MKVFRLSKLHYAKDLSGRGAEKSGGRWNSKGTALVYAGETRALCTTEIAVHMPLGNVPTEYVLVTLVLPSSIPIGILKYEQLPIDWKSFPHSHSTQIIGDTFVSEEKYAVLKVPSVVVPGEYNYLINPNHNDFKKITIESIEPFDFDERLFIK